MHVYDEMKCNQYKYKSKSNSQTNKQTNKQTNDSMTQSVKENPYHKYESVTINGDVEQFKDVHGYTKVSPNSSFSESAAPLLGSS